MDISITQEQLTAIGRLGDLNQKVVEIEAQIALIDELDLEVAQAQKLKELEAALITVNGLIGSLPRLYTAKIIDVSQFGSNAFKWPLNQETMAYHLIDAAISGGVLSCAAKESLGLEASTHHLYTEEK